MGANALHFDSLQIGKDKIVDYSQTSGYDTSHGYAKPRPISDITIISYGLLSRKSAVISQADIRVQFMSFRSIGRRRLSLHLFLQSTLSP